MKRYAIVRTGGQQEGGDLERVAAYLPGNYEVAAVTIATGAWGQAFYDKHPVEERVFVIEGEDNAGWTLSDYVLPRLASGLIFGYEVDLSHPVMKEIAA